MGLDSNSTCYSISGSRRHRQFVTREQATQEITEYIEIFYNRIRKQARLGYLSPAAFNQKYYKNKIAA
jgi:putative transposase